MKAKGKRSGTWDFYGVRIIKEIVVEGEPDPTLIDEHYDDTGVKTFEESIMIVRAQSFNHAYKIAEKKAKEYEEPYVNIYGQQVLWKFIDAVDCFIIYDNPIKSGAEVYSCLVSAPRNEKANDFIDKWFNFDEGERQCINNDFS